MRTDIHRPGVINPDDYQFVAFGYFGSSDTETLIVMREETQARIAHFKRTGGMLAELDGTCMICGKNHVLYVSYFYHEDTNTYIRVGWQCAQKLELAQDDGDFRIFRTAVKEAHALKAGKRKAYDMLVLAGLSPAWDIWLADYSSSFRNEEHTIQNIVGYLVRHGAISDKQEALLCTLLSRINTRAALEAEHTAETAAAKPAPRGRIEITGEVLNVKFVESFIIGQLNQKMLVRHTDGWRLWVTVPGVIDEVKRGDHVSLNVTVTPSNDDPKFAFGKRPTKAYIIEETA